MALRYSIDASLSFPSATYRSPLRRNSRLATSGSLPHALPKTARAQTHGQSKLIRMEFQPFRRSERKEQAQSAGRRNQESDWSVTTIESNTYDPGVALDPGR